MKNEDLQNLQGFYLNELEKRGSEENIKMLVVKDLLHLLGYKKEWFDCEESRLLNSWFQSELRRYAHAARHEAFQDLQRADV